MRAAKRLYDIIDNKPTIDPEEASDSGIKKDKIEGYLKFERVTFAYPTRKELKVLKNISFDIEPKQISVLVGESGCGKSTIVQLALRFYDPDWGRILLDGTDIKDYNISWLRAQFGYVGQDPSLFDGTILENIQI